MATPIDNSPGRVPEPTPGQPARRFTGGDPDPELIARGIGTLPQSFRNCHEVARALVETKRLVFRRSWSDKLRQPTQYERLRHQAIANVRSLIERLGMLAIDELRPDIIRAVAHLQEVERCCQRCPMTNATIVASGEPFICLAAGQLAKDEEVSFRFKLDERGRIIESR